MLGNNFSNRLLVAAGAVLGLATQSYAVTVNSKILILARDDYSASTASSGLNGYGIPFQSVIVPKEGITLPQLKGSSDQGNYGGIIIMGAVSYDYDGTWGSALTTAQWDALYAYQTDFKVRMVRADEFPGPAFGSKTAKDDGSGCCADGVEQLVSISNSSAFGTANLKTNAGVSTSGLWHYPAVVTNASTTWEVAKFGPGGTFTGDTTAAVINNFNGREQFVWFMSWATDWSATSTFLQHAHIHWMTRGVFSGKRKVHLSPQIDDVQLSTGLYLPADVEFKSRTGDLEAHVTWQNDINGRLPSGSAFWLEMGHNGNGDIIAAVEEPGAEGTCKPDYAVDYPYPPDTELEFMKPIGTGEDRWPTEFEEYGWTKPCAQLDEFASWFLDQDNLNAFAHVSHTFTHLELNNATYHDASREIHFNQDWIAQMGIDKARRWSPKGLIPPAITGLHNGDVIRAWMDNGLAYVVGDNTRTPLKNANNVFWPLISTVASNGHAGLYIIPRFATTIYYNCDKPACTVQEWIDTSGGSGNFNNLLDDARRTNTRYLLGLQSDPYMFHQANLRQTDMETITVGSKTGKMSLVMAWVETIAQEMYRLTDWPITSLKHDDTAKYFIDRMTLDGCQPQLSYTYASNGQSIASVTVTTNGNTCSVPVPVTIPSGSASASGGSSTLDQVGSEPPIVWVTMGGSPVTLSLSNAVAL
ncbi:hypothetical protein N3K66_004345 [Trichothecium roseum]|uniref:Uncharacterized protein n=1 Tax=Trichothecium roseum TaxID=47278 RepID=A0ACC0V0Z5_9HYPO|nr:hypothetical protein N3K66_004345 [Trichothecium roseum]